MIRVMDTPRVNRYAVQANALSIGGLLILLASVVAPLFVAETGSYAWVAMIVGAGVSMTGIYFANRWVRKPRPEEQIDKACKGLADSYVVFHYPRMPIDHLLLTPSGILVIETIAYDGLFSYKNGKWKESMSMGRALRYIVEEHLGNPSDLLASEIANLKEKLNQAGLSSIQVKGLILWTHPAVQLEIENPPVPCCRIDKLRKYTDLGGAKLLPETYEAVKAYLVAQTQ